MECAGVDAAVKEGDPLDVDLAGGTITNRRTGAVLSAAPMPPFMRELVEAGGLVPYVRRSLEKR
jgi:3-isopropylmalate dehydratase small subunit